MAVLERRVKVLSDLSVASAASTHNNIDALARRSCVSRSQPVSSLIAHPVLTPRLILLLIGH